MKDLIFDKHRMKKKRGAASQYALGSWYDCLFNVSVSNKHPEDLEEIHMCFILYEKKTQQQ